jgi:HD-GYP domain-containing protein (c-di-GMP phosphodiesterase class II)
VLDALLSDRPYRKRINVEDALQYIRSQSGKQFDPAVVNALMRCLQKNTLHLLEA